jgi:hypothetical protein
MGEEKKGKASGRFSGEKLRKRLLLLFSLLRGEAI